MTLLLIGVGALAALGGALMSVVFVSALTHPDPASPVPSAVLIVPAFALAVGVGPIYAGSRLPRRRGATGAATTSEAAYGSATT